MPTWRWSITRATASRLAAQNYLVPTDTDISTPQKAGESLVAVEELLERTGQDRAGDDRAARCLPDRRVPGRAGVRAARQRQDDGGATAPGSASCEGPTPIGRPDVPADSLGMVIGFAASPGQPALDGEAGRQLALRSSAAQAFCRRRLFVRRPHDDGAARRFTSRPDAQQLPWMNSSLRRVLSFGSPAPAGDADEAAIREGRRQLLLSIANTPDDLRREVEAAATKAAVPMDAVYGLLQALGQNVPSDPAELDQLLKRQTETIKKLMAER